MTSSSRLDRIGCDELLTSAGAVTIDEDVDAGGPRKLVQVHLPNFSWRPLRYLQCRCPSTGRTYLLRVPEAVENCHAAAAWLAGFDDPDEYWPIFET
jgi:hypothetical protein